MEIIINHAILHIVDNKTRKYIYSENELDIDSDMVSEFLQKHIKKVFRDSSTKEGTFNPDSGVLQIFSEYKNGAAFFADTTRKICEKLVTILDSAPDIPSADIVFVQFDVGYDSYMAILKFTHREYYGHEICSSSTCITKNAAAGKIEQAVIIPYEPMLLRIIEKPYPINGQPSNYFSSVFLECTPEPSKKEIAKIIKDVTEEIAEKYGDDDMIEAKVNAALIEEALEKEGEVRLENVAAAAFEDEDMRRDFVAALRENEIIADVQLGEKFAMAQFGSYKFKASNGIEVRFPVGLMDDSEIVDIIKNDDSSLTITLKGLRRS